MNREQQIEFITGLANEVLQEHPSCFLVEVKIKPTNNLQVFVDADEGISISTCTLINKALYKKLEESAIYPEGDFSLEVSSPGLDEPLKLVRQYKKNVGRQVEVQLKSGEKLEGKLLNAGEEHIELEQVKGKGKKQEILHHNILFNDIKSTKIQIIF
jgi:ribosome maturation factor RimP